MSDQKTPAKVFSAPKVHSKIKITRLIVEILVLSIVLVGTALTLFWPTNFSVPKTIENLKEILSLRKERVETKGLSFEEQVRALTDGKVIEIASIEKSPDSFLLIKDKEGLLVIFSPLKDLENQVRTLQTLLTKAKIEKRAVSLVDFRFDKLVVRYK